MSINKEQFLANLAHAETGVGLDALDLEHRPRGLADRQSVESLAQTYLEEQAKHWPELAQSGVLSQPTPKANLEIADHFDRAYMLGKLPVFDRKLPDGIGIGAVYTRYSDPNSNPRSLNQQLSNALRGAAKDRVFVPWEYFFADAAITGTNQHRRGYQLLKQLIPRTMAPVSTVYIDELGRASRDHIESLTLGRLVHNSDKRLVGVTDGFDSANPASKMTLTVFAMLHELFVDQLRDKVDRGMTDAFNQGKPLYKPGFGYALIPVLNDDGQQIVTGDGKVVQQNVIVEEEAVQVRRIFTLFAEGKYSPQKISLLFNQEQIGDRAWTGTQVRNMLRRPMYHGREAWGKTIRQIEPESGTVKIVDVPEDRWQWRDMPHLRIVDEQLWQATQNRLAESSNAYSVKDPSVSRSEVNPKRLFHLVCGHCGGEMWCARGGERQVVRCNRGHDGSARCCAKGSKTLKQIEESLLNHILEQFASDDFVDQLLSAANAALVEYAKQPRVDVGPLREQVARKEAARDRILRRLETIEDDGLMDRVFETVRKLEGEIAELKKDLEQSKIGQVPATPIRREDLADLIGSLRDLLYDDLSFAGAVLVALAGPVKLIQTPVAGKRRPQWTAELTLNHAKVFVEIARQRNCPSTGMWEFLSNRSWTFAGTVKIPIRMFTMAERIAKTAAEMLLAGSSRNAVAVAIGSDVDTVDQAMHDWEAGRRCYLPPKEFAFRSEAPSTLVDRLGPEVVRLVDEGKLSVKAIATRLSISLGLVSKAYRRFKLDETIELAKQGKTLSIPHPLRLPAEVHARIRELLIAGGMSYRAISREVGCDHHAVSDAHKRMRKQDAA